MSFSVYLNVFPQMLQKASNVINNLHRFFLWVTYILQVPFPDLVGMYFKYAMVRQWCIQSKKFYKSLGTLLSELCPIIWHNCIRDTKSSEESIQKSNCATARRSFTFHHFCLFRETVNHFPSIGPAKSMCSFDQIFTGGAFAAFTQPLQDFPFSFISIFGRKHSF